MTTICKKRGAPRQSLADRIGRRRLRESGELYLIMLPVLVMIFIYYFKNILSIKDIESVLTPITEKTFDKEESLDMTSVYEEICQMEKSRIDDLKKDVTNSYELAMDSFSELPPEEEEYLQLFAFICNLSFDVYVKKQIIEKMIDDLADSDSSAKKKK